MGHDDVLRESWRARWRKAVNRDERFMGLLAAGGAILAISVIAHFRVPLLPDIGRELSLSAVQLGMITTAFAAGRVVFSIPSGNLADRWSATRMFTGSAGALGIGSLLLATAPNGTMTLVAAFILGIASTVANTTGMTLFASSVSARRRGSAMAAFSAFLLGGQALGPTVGGVVAGFSGWRTALVVGGVSAFVVMVILELRRRVAERVQTKDAAGPAHGSADQDAPRDGIGAGQRAVLYFVPFVMFFTLAAMPQTLVPIMGARYYGFDAAVIGLALGVGGMCRFLGALVGGVISDRVSRKAALVPGMALMAGGVALLALDVGPWAWMAAIVTMSLASFGISVAATMLADHAAGQNVGRRLGPFRFVGDLGLVMGPLVTTALFATWGRTVAVLGVTGLLAVCTVLCGFALDETRRARSDVAAR